MDTVADYKTKEDFAKSFIPAFKQSLRLAESMAAGERPINDSREWLNKLKAEAEDMKAASPPAPKGPATGPAEKEKDTRKIMIGGKFLEIQ
jgi:hypothetical protein